MSTRETPWEQGYSARMRGEPRDSCPWLDMFLWKESEWLAGWDFVDKKLKEAEARGKS